MLASHDVNAVNVSIRHALPDPGTYLAWAPNEVFAFVLYYKQRTDPASRREVAQLDARADRLRHRERRTLLSPVPAASRRARSSRARIRTPTSSSTSSGASIRRASSRTRSGISISPDCRWVVRPSYRRAHACESSGRGAHRARHDERLRARRRQRVSHASRMGSGLRQRGVRKLARATGSGQANFRTSASVGTFWRVVRSDLARAATHAIPRASAPRHARRHRREHGARVWAQGNVRGHGRPTCSS